LIGLSIDARSLHSIRIVSASSAACPGREIAAKHALIREKMRVKIRDYELEDLLE